MAEQINNALYDEMANTWWKEAGALQGLKALNPGRFAYMRKLLDKQGINPKQTIVVDVGRGGGYASEYMTNVGMQVIGIDPSEATIDAAREHVSDVQQVITKIYRILKPGGLFFYDTNNRTTFSWLFLIKVAQDIPFTRVLPKNTHVWHMFIKPKELKKYLRNAGFSPGGLTGFAPAFSPRAMIDSTLSQGIDSILSREKIETKKKRQGPFEWAPHALKMACIWGGPKNSPQ